MNSKLCEQCGISMTKKPKESYKDWGDKRFCSFKCHGLNFNPEQNTEEVFWSLVDKSDDCWQWLGKLARGYGQFSYQSKTRRAHRLSWYFVKGEWPKNETLDHLCRNRACVNPDHLEEVGHVENVMRGDSPASLNSRKTHCKNGHEFSIANTYLSKDGRHCKTCRRYTLRIWNAKQAAKKASGIS